MTSTPPPPGENETPVRSGQVEIRVRGRLDSRWSSWFDGLAITAEGGTTVLHGPVVDQAALFGILRKLGDLALPLISVDFIDPGSPPTTRSTSREGSSP